MSEQRYPEPTPGAMIFNEEGKIFLMKSPKWSGKYILPGGHVELGETVKDAVRREVKEETGMDVYDIEYIDFQEVIFDDLFVKKKHFIFLDHICKTKSKKVKLNDEGSEYVWVTLEEALKLPIIPYLRKTIENYLKKK